MSQCQTPVTVQVKNLHISKVPVPCGKCPHCVKRYASGWSFRLMQQERISESAYFLTLTYESQHLTRSPNGYRTLVKSDLQKFMKRLRHLHPVSHTPLKYYAVGEYGTHGQRPHYHMVLFNSLIEHIDPAWSMGSIYYGDVGPASVGYCLKYMMKKGRIPVHGRDDRQPEFSLMSKGLGKNYLTPSMVKWHLADPSSRLYCTTLDNHKIAMPRYYKGKLFSDLYFENQELADTIRRVAGHTALQRIRLNEVELRKEANELGMDYDYNKVQHDLASFIEMSITADIGKSL